MPEDEDPKPEEKPTSDVAAGVLKALEAERAKNKKLENEMKMLRTAGASSKSEMDTLTERLAAAEKRQAESDLRAMRLEIAAEKGLTKSQAARLQGSTIEELTSDADELIEQFGIGKKEEKAPAKGEGKDGVQPERETRRPKEKLQSGSSPESEKPVSADDLATQVIKRQRGY